MKKTLSMIVAILLFAVLGFGSLAVAEQKLKVVTTIFPPYDFIRAIAGGAVELTMLLPPGAESHSFEPTPRDIITIQDCDIFIYTGGEADVWVDRILSSMDTGNMTVLKMLDMVDAVEEVIVEGMEDDHGHEEEEAFDPGKVYDRALSEWTGSWKSLAPYLEDGSLDEYVQSRADTDGIGFSEQMEKQKNSWRTDGLNTFMVAGDRFSIDTGEATFGGTYKSEGFSIVERDDGSASVWYQYALADGAAGMPRYIVFNDHGYGTPPEGAETQTEAEDEHGVGHTHLKYGDASFEEVIAMEGWNPFYVEAAASNEQIMDTLLGHGSHEHGEMDEHVWTSPANAREIVAHLTDALAALDPANADAYRANASAYQAQLDALHAAFQEVISQASRKTIVFGDRFPFRYLADAYGLTYYAAFPGCATETEASATTIAFLIDKVKEEAIPVVFTIELSNGKIADAIAESTGAVKLEMHSCHNLSKQEFDAGLGYLDMMRKNVEALEEALR